MVEGLEKLDWDGTIILNFPVRWSVQQGRVFVLIS
jgi:hypothetical protein